jgi:hypothetical protein
LRFSAGSALALLSGKLHAQKKWCPCHWLVV